MYIYEKQINNDNNGRETSASYNIVFLVIDFLRISFFVGYFSSSVLRWYSFPPTYPIEVPHEHLDDVALAPRR